MDAHNTVWGTLRSYVQTLDWDKAWDYLPDQIDLSAYDPSSNLDPTEQMVHYILSSAAASCSYEFRDALYEGQYSILQRCRECSGGSLYCFKGCCYEGACSDCLGTGWHKDLLTRICSLYCVDLSL